MIIDDEEFGDDLNVDDGERVVCLECGSDDLEVTGEDADGNAEFECLDCGERFTEGEEEE